MLNDTRDGRNGFQEFSMPLVWLNTIGLISNILGVLMLSIGAFLSPSSQAAVR
jgi:hypothetical protein